MLNGTTIDIKPLKTSRISISGGGPVLMNISSNGKQSGVDIKPKGNANIGVLPPKKSCVDVYNGDIEKAVQKHNLDEQAHPYILENFSTKEYSEHLVEVHNTSILSHQDIRNALKTFIHEQGIASSEWVIQHNLNKYPSVSVVDSAGNEIISDVHYVDTNNIVVYLNAPFKGKAYLN